MGNDQATDRLAIHDVLIRYCRGVDRGDATLIQTCYHADAVDDHGSFYGPSSDFITSACLPVFDAYESMMHCISNELIEFDGADFADSEANFIAYMRRVQGDHNVLDTLGGRYVDRFERRSEEWRISHRVVVYEWGDSKVVSDTFPPNVELFESGRRYDLDVAYTRTTTRPGRAWTAKPSTRS